MRQRSKEPTVQEFVRTIDRRLADLKQWDYLETLLSLVESERPQRIRCLALGEPTQWMNAQFQLALLILLVKRLKLTPEDVTVYDPVFKSMDVQVLEHFGYKVVQDHPEDEGTLWYMPHGPTSLVAELAPQMSVYLGNDMVRFQPRIDVSQEKLDRLACLKRGKVTSVRVDRQDRWYTAMSDMALHRVKFHDSDSDSESD